MPCTNCYAEFTHLRKEHGCSSCSFSFCAKCLPQKIILPQLSRKPVSVCQNCYDRLTASNQQGNLNNDFSGTERACGLSRTIITSEPIVAGASSNSKEEEIEKRLANLRKNESEEQQIMSVQEIEERLARLRGVSVQEVRSPSLYVVDKRKRNNEETPEKLIEKIKDEINLEKKWSDRTDNGDGDFGELVVQSDAGELKSTSSDDILFGDRTLRNLKELQDTLATVDICPQNAEILSLHQSRMNKEMNALLKLTKQNSLKTEKITEEISKYWERSLDKMGGDTEIVDEDVEIDETDLKEVLDEAERAVDEEMKAVKKSKKHKKGFFSRIFHSTD